MTLVLYRDKNQEDRPEKGNDYKKGVHLWFWSKDGKNIASVVGGPGDIRTRLSIRGKSYEFGHPFVARTAGDIPLIAQKPNEWAKVIQNEIERVGQKDIKVTASCDRCGKKV